MPLMPGDNPIPPALTTADGRKQLAPHPEWIANIRRWHWMLDSYEGGEAYRDATYGNDSRGMPIRNLVRHRREYPLNGGYSAAVGMSAAAAATDDPYEMRRARTTVPGFVREAVDAHLSKLYNREVTRKGPDALEAWWADVDGLGTTVDRWMKSHVAPLLMVLGHIDVIFDRPPADEDRPVRTKADEVRMGLDRCVASHIIPDNLPWWRIDRRGVFTDALVRQVDGDGVTTWLLWDRETWARFDDRGKPMGEPVEHGYGVVPIIRCFDRRRVRARDVGYSRYEGLAEYQRDAYNRESELVISDSTQAHPTLMVPKKWIESDGETPVGPSYSLPIDTDANGNQIKAEYLEPPKGAADSLRKNIANIRDAADREACLTKPAGAAGTTGATVSQSGVSKRIDQGRGDELLGAIAGTLKTFEETGAVMAMRVLSPGVEPDLASFQIDYPATFDLSSPEEKIERMERFTGWLVTAGDCPATMRMMAGDFIRDAYRGLDDETYDEILAEIDAYLTARSDASRADGEGIADELNAMVATRRLRAVAGSTSDDEADDETEGREEA